MSIRRLREAGLCQDVSCRGLVNCQLLSKQKIAKQRKKMNILSSVNDGKHLYTESQNQYLSDH